MIQLEITVDSATKTLIVKAEYCKYNTEFFRRNGGTWDKSKFVWILPDEPCVRKALKEQFCWVEGCGERQIAVGLSNLEMDRREDEIYRWRGYVLCRRRYVEAPVRQPVGVIMTHGSYPKWGGSRKHPGPSADTGEDGHEPEWLLTIFDGDSVSEEASFNAWLIQNRSRLFEQYKAELSKE